MVGTILFLMIKIIKFGMVKSLKKIVTHHWSSNKMKGFDVYKKLDELSEEVDWKGKIEFTYIGNLPKGFNFKNSRVINPLSGEKLAEQLVSHHIYITA